MEKSFWENKWQNNELGFHEQEVNSQLATHFSALNLKKNARVFVPLCGKTNDIAWLLSQGYQVVGVELVQSAVDELFENLSFQPTITVQGELRHYHAPSIDIFQGDCFALSESLVGNVDATYDRAALVALPEDMRIRYTKHLLKITQDAPQLLLCFDYDQSLYAGPPFAISEAMVEQYYGQHYQPTLLESKPTNRGAKGECPTDENVWLLSAK